MSDDHHLFDEIVRATRGVAHDDVSKAIEKIRSLLSESQPVFRAPVEDTERKSQGSRTRIERGGRDRKESDTE